MRRAQNVPNVALKPDAKTSRSCSLEKAPVEIRTGVRSQGAYGIFSVAPTGSTFSFFTTSRLALRISSQRPGVP